LAWREHVQRAAGPDESDGAIRGTVGRYARARRRLAADDGDVLTAVGM
jgi:hypothetical protein